MIRALLAVALLLAAQAHAAITFVADTTADNSGSTATSIACGEPSGAVSGDLLVAIVSIMDDTEAGTWDAPNGFADIDNDYKTGNTHGTNDSVHSVLYQVRGGSSIGTTTFTYTGGTAARVRCTIMAFRGVNTTTPFDVTFSGASHRQNRVNSAGTGTPSAITTATANAWAMLLYYDNTSFSGDESSVAPSGYTLRSDYGASNRTHLMATKLVAAAGTETPAAWANAGYGATSDSVHWTLALKPAATTNSAALRRRR